MGPSGPATLVIRARLPAAAPPVDRQLKSAPTRPPAGAKQGSRQRPSLRANGLLNLQVVAVVPPDGWYDSFAFAGLASSATAARTRQGGEGLGELGWPEPVGWKGVNRGRSSAPVSVRAVATGTIGRQSAG